MGRLGEMMRNPRDTPQREFWRRFLLIYAACIAFVAVFTVGWAWWGMG